MLKSWTAPAAPPLDRVWERLGPQRHWVLWATREGRREKGQEEEEEERGWLPARRYLKPGWNQGGGGRSRQRAPLGTASAPACAGGGGTARRGARPAPRQDRDSKQVQTNAPRRCAASPPAASPRSPGATLPTPRERTAPLQRVCTGRT